MGSFCEAFGMIKIEAPSTSKKKEQKAINRGSRRSNKSYRPLPPQHQQKPSKKEPRGKKTKE